MFYIIQRYYKRRYKHQIMSWYPFLPRQKPGWYYSVEISHVVFMYTSYLYRVYSCGLLNYKLFTFCKFFNIRYHLLVCHWCWLVLVLVVPDTTTSNTFYFQKNTIMKQEQEPFVDTRKRLDALFHSANGQQGRWKVHQTVTVRAKSVVNAQILPDKPTLVQVIFMAPFTNMD